ncbi:MAG TPA: 4-hydroxy-tetrahydrodipicolinate synthase [Dehalococcoidia bacterium]|jgi:4-hydroxy-tetrahydrodipicolinate synthase|nr:4-hydroxy-tetrahydrodipicolinate synthase [Dehalococcoidia bacterium]MEE2925874.1 4-hydroxy-tetrahydrodipicolinate synthase [Chloroflexota bacterium]HIM47381.1 4-hydroxy-tetrahydrodipicolinate synthase [Dehalococcoidia bacterium]|tara:strand:- start:355 stop:1251 length:897 start_codon:yes stop_codon:yes gene_type:complete
MTEIGRLITAMVTPFDEKGAVDYEQAKCLANALLDSGSDGLVITGTTGEGPTLSAEEKIRLYAEVKEAIGSRGAVIAGTTDNDTAKSIELSAEAESVGADALLLTVPAYNKPPQEGLYQHFKAIAESTSLPCVLYNVTSRTSLNMTDETTIRLSEIDNIVGVKEAGSDLNQITRIIDGAGDDFRVWSGNDDETFSIMATGGYGVVSVLSHLVGNQIKQMMGYLLEGDVEKAAAEHRRLLPLFKVMFIVSNPIPLKYSLNHVGFNVGPMRLPLVPPDDKSAEKILEVLADYEIDLAVPA